MLKPNENFKYRGKIAQKHVDFLLCDPSTMEPLIAIELDDKSHQGEKQKERDAFVNLVFETADLPLLHIPVKRSYAPKELESLMEQILDKGGSLADTVSKELAHQDNPAATAIPSSSTTIIARAESPQQSSTTAPGTPISATSVIPGPPCHSRESGNPDPSLDPQLTNSLLVNSSTVDNSAQTSLCPRCSVPMILRTAKHGPNKGSQFYGCTNYPQCKEILTP